MRTSQKILVAFVVITMLIGGVSYFKVSAESAAMTDQQIQLIRDSCVSTKSTLNQLHSSDALMRVNRGQIYESMSTKLMEKFNSRVSSNSLNNSGLVLATNSYESILDTFRLDYITYEKQLTLTIGIDCSKQPLIFYNAIDLARTERNQVHTDVVNLDQSINQYQAVVDQFVKDNQTTLQGSK
jgi:hypothetical protein